MVAAGALLGRRAKGSRRTAHFPHGGRRPARRLAGSPARRTQRPSSGGCAAGDGPGAACSTPRPCRRDVPRTPPRAPRARRQAARAASLRNRPRGHARGTDGGLLTPTRAASLPRLPALLRASGVCAPQPGEKSRRVPQTRLTNGQPASGALLLSPRAECGHERWGERLRTKSVHAASSESAGPFARRECGEVRGAHRVHTARGEADRGAARSDNSLAPAHAASFTTQ